jgi:hypothetical protein
MKPLKSLGVVLPFLALGATACGANTTPSSGPDYKFTMLADFELGFAFNPTTPAPSLWNGGLLSDADTSVLPDGYGMKVTFKTEPLPTPHPTNPGVMSTTALHKTELGAHTLWGTVIYGDFNNKKPVDLSRFRGISMWARSAGYSGFTVKIGIADWGSFDFGQVGTIIPDGQLCDALDTTVGGRGCYDDYSAKIYPDGEWRRYDIEFSQMTTGGWGLPHAFDLTRIYRLKISMLPGTKYDLYFDDIAFFE